ncbi:hypothetical protein Saga11_38770 [Bacillus safensis]|nr:hypothetical protein Saga11_38770 [Bacillus safensis]
MKDRRCISFSRAACKALENKEKEHISYKTIYDRSIERQSISLYKGPADIFI